MKKYADFRHGENGFLRDMQANVQEAHQSLLAVCAKSSDPMVTAHYYQWVTLNDFAEHLAKPRKESSE